MKNFKECNLVQIILLKGFCPMKITITQFPDGNQKWYFKASPNYAQGKCSSINFRCTCLPEGMAILSNSYSGLRTWPNSGHFLYGKKNVLMTSESSDHVDTSFTQTISTYWFEKPGWIMLWFTSFSLGWNLLPPMWPDPTL